MAYEKKRKAPPIVERGEKKLGVTFNPGAFRRYRRLLQRSVHTYRGQTPVALFRKTPSYEVLISAAHDLNHGSFRRSCPWDSAEKKKFQREERVVGKSHARFFIYIYNFESADVYSQEYLHTIRFSIEYLVQFIWYRWPPNDIAVGVKS